MKKVIQIIMISLLLWLAYTKYKEFKNNSLFNVTKVNINVKNEVLIKDLYGSIKGIEGKNILGINKKELESRILEDVRVKDVTLEKEMPDTLNFNIKEKKPFAYIEYNGQIYITNEDGIVYGYMNESKKYNMPLFRVNNEEDIESFIEIMKKIPYESEVSQIYKVDNGAAVTINNGLKIITNSDVEEDKYRVVEKLYNQVKLKLKKREKIDYIDLRFDDYIIKKSRG